MARRIAWGAALVLVTMVGTQVSAQMPRRQNQTEPDWWVGLSYGLLQAGTVRDGGTNSTWAFGYTSEWAATFDKSLGGGASIGVLAGFATAPLDYTPYNYDPSLPASCGLGCSGHGDVTQVLVNFQFNGRRFGGTSFHGVTGLDVGATQYGNLKDSTGAKLPSGSSWDPTFGFRFGFGYYLSPWSDLYGAEELSTVLHHQSGGTVQTNTPRVLTTRFGLRIGF